MLHTRQEGVSGWGAGVSSPLLEEPTSLTALYCSSELCLVTLERGQTRRGNGFCHLLPATATQGDPSAPRVPRPRDALGRKGLRGSQTQQPWGLRNSGHGTRVRKAEHPRGWEPGGVPQGLHSTAADGRASPPGLPAETRPVQFPVPTGLHRRGECRALTCFCSPKELPDL